MNPRVRFAPSPTGFLHLGGLRTALFNYLFAARNNGKLILRIEDTDQSRLVPGSIEYLRNIFNWLGIRFDEGPYSSGHHAPYIQSERLSIYRRYTQFLVEKGGAYHCFCSKERLQSLRKNSPAGGKRGYDGLCRTLTSRQVQDRLRTGSPYVIRLKVPCSGSTFVNDVVYGRVEFSNENIDDQVLLKSDGFPTYHLANVVDDHLMEISHVLRGEEWLSSTCKHKILYSAFDWTAPVFAHIPLLTTKSGSKLSKRSKDVHVQAYKDKGYTPEGLLNFVALLGWSPKTEKEVFSLQELTEAFNLEGINRAAAIVDESKLDWLNSINAQTLFRDEKMMSKFIKDLRKELLSRKAFSLSTRDVTLEDQYLSNVISIIQERTCLIPSIPDQAPYFWVDPQLCTDKIKSHSNAVNILKELVEIFTDRSFSREYLNSSLKKFDSSSIKSLLRHCVTGGLAGPDIVQTMVVIGRTRTIHRLQRAIEILS